MKPFAPFVIAATLAAAPAAAQEDLLSACSGVTISWFPGPPALAPEGLDNEFRYLCGQVVSVLAAVQPAVGIAFTGGNPVLGTATTLGRRFGGLPRVSITARATGALVDMPDLLDGFQAELGSNDELAALGSERLPLGSLQGDVAIGLFNGFSLGPTAGGLGAIDLLGSISYVPTIDDIGLTEEIVNWGVGARVGILKQGLMLPGVSVSGMYRSMGQVRFGDLAEDPATFSTDLSAVSLRAEASKGFLALNLGVGAGYDLYRSDVSFNWELTCPATTCTPEATGSPTSPVSGRLETAAWNIHGNVGVGLALINLVAELGYQKPTDAVGAADLQEAGLPNRPPAVEDLDAGRIFGGIGVRLSF